MKIGQRISIIVCSVFALIILVGICSQTYIVAPGFEEIEKWFIHNEVEWINDLINRESERISALCNDWAQWDDTYEYTFSQDEDYVSTNLSVETLSLNFLNFAAVVDTNGEIIISRSLTDDEFIDPLFEDFKKQSLKTDNPLLVTDPKGFVTGIAESSKGPVFIAAYPILKTDGSGPPAGTLIMARLFDSNFLGPTFSQNGHAIRITEEKIADCGNDIYDDTYITNYKSGSYSVCKELHTVYGDVNYVLQLITPNFVGEHNRKYTIIIISLVVIVCILGLALMLTFIMRKVVKPIGSLENEIRQMRDKKSLEFIPERKVKDEIGLFASEFNEMVARIKEVEKLREQASAQLEDSNRELQRFAYSVSHDLKEPLRTITSYLQLIDTTVPLSDETKEYMGHVTTASKRMYSLINDLLEYSKSNTQEHPLKKCDINAIISEIVSELHLIIEETGAQILTVGKLPNFEGYAPLIRQVLRNLLTNAIKYTKEDAVPKIEIGSSENEEEYTLYVKDNGKGIENDYTEKVFDMFQRLDSDHTGSGLGLAICKKAVERHGGRIWVESEYGQGSTFYFTVSKKLKNNGEQS